MTSRANAIQRARKLAAETQETAYVVYDPSMIDWPKHAYYPATAAEVDTYYAGCRIVATVEPEEEAPHA